MLCDLLCQTDFAKVIFLQLQATGPREKPEEEKEDEMESRAFHGFPQIPLRHIVTSLTVFIIPNIHTQTNTHSYTKFGCQGTCQQCLTTGAQTEGGRSLNSLMDAERQREAELNQPFRMPQDERCVLSPLLRTFDPLPPLHSFPELFGHRTKCHF